MKLESVLEEFLEQSLSESDIDLTRVYCVLTSISDRLSQPVNGLLKKLSLKGFEYGSCSRRDHITPKMDRSVYPKGMSPLDSFFGNDLDVVMFNITEARLLVEYFDNQLIDHRLHIFLYRQMDIRAIMPFLDKRIESLSGLDDLIPFGAPSKVITERKVRNQLKKGNHRQYTLGKSHLGVNSTDWAEDFPFLQSQNILHADLGLIIIQFLSAVNLSDCEGLVQEVKNQLHNVDCSKPSIYNTRTLYDPHAYPYVEKALTETPRYMYDGFMKLFRTIFMKEYGSAQCCEQMNGIDFFRSLERSLKKKELPLEDISNALSIAASIKVCARDPVNMELVKSAGDKLRPDYFRLCQLIDQAYF